MGRGFVIHKHDATNLHYDLRLSIGGVLKSWAIPKGPSMNTSIKRLAMLAEDHKLSYARFEGTIPEDKYGAGTVMIWDRGTYRNLNKTKTGKPLSMEAAYKRGEITFWLNGKKLKGGFALIRTTGLGAKKWLLVKMDDEEASKKANPVKTQTKSAKSGKTMSQIKKDTKK